MAGIRPGCFEDLGDDRILPANARGAELEHELAGLEGCLSGDVRKGPDARQHSRHVVAKRVQVFSLAEDLRVVGPAYHALTVNISTGGLAILQSKAPEHPYLAVDFSRTTSALPPVLLKRLRVASVGPAFEVAGEFLSRVEF